jgi:hypothetical protein
MDNHKISLKDFIQTFDSDEAFERLEQDDRPREPQGVGRPKAYSSLDILAVHTLYAPNTFGFKKVADLLSGKEMSRADFNTFIVLMVRNGWTTEETDEILERISSGKCKMSHTQARRLYNNGHQYINDLSGE